MKKEATYLTDELFELMGDDQSLVMEGNEDFTNTHEGFTSVMFAAALYELPEILEVRVAVNEAGNPLHYFGCLERDGIPFYLDATGIYSNAEDILSRYKEHSRMYALDQDAGDCNAIRFYRDREAGIIDEMPGEDCGEQIEALEKEYAELTSLWAELLKESHELTSDNIRFTM